MGSLALTGSKSIQKKGFFPIVQGAHHVPYAYCYRCPYNKTPDTCAVECAKAIEDTLFRHTLPAEEVAAIVVEPIQGEGGYVVPPPRFLKELRCIADKHGILLIFDEIQCGMGRTGKMFAAEHFGVSPDIMTLAKGIASGMPLGATIARAEVMNWKPGAHASTFGGNPVCVASALATIELLEQELIDNAAKVGATHEVSSGRVAQAVSDCRRRARTRPDDRHRDGPRSSHEGTSSGAARSFGRVVLRKRACWCWARVQTRYGFALRW